MFLQNIRGASRNFEKSFHISSKTFEAVKLASSRFASPEADQNAPLIIVHGLFGQKQNWNSVGKALHHKLKASVYAVDARNHGSSPHTESMTYTEMAEDLVGFIDEVRNETGKEQINLLGHSMGGKIVMRMAVEQKWNNRIKKLIVEDVSPKGYSKRHVEFRHLIKAMRNVNLSRTRKEILVDLEEIIPELSLRQFILTNLQPNKSKGKMEWKCNIDTIDKYVEELLGCGISTGCFDGPTLFLHGANSSYVTDEHKPDIERIFPNVIYDAIPGAGHWVHAEKPQLFIDSVYSFLNS